MNTQAHVDSVEALRAFRRALQRYEYALRDSMAGIGLEIRRAVNWVTEDRTRYWPDQVRKSEERVAAARTELELCQFASLKDEKRSCMQEKKNLALAIERLRTCEQKIKDVKHWRYLLEHQADETEGRTARLVHYLEHDLPRAMAALDRIIAALERYGEPRRENGTPAT